MRLAFILILFIASSSLLAQSGGRTVYQFLGLPSSARATALGGHLIALNESDLSAAYHNPATLGNEMDNQLMFSHDFFLSDINRGLAAYGTKSEKLQANLFACIQYISYGDFKRTNEQGVIEGDFQANEYALTFGAGKALYDKLHVGASLRLINSQFESYNSWGIAADAGLMYHIDEDNMVFSLVLKNMGTQISAYDQVREPLPFDLQLGFSKRLEHLPFRFSIIAQRVHQWDIAYDDPSDNEQTLFGEEITDNTGSFSDNLFRHLIFSGEFYIGTSEALRLRMSYDHLRNRELRLEDFNSMAGFAFGFGIKAGKFRIDYGFGKYQVAAASHHFSISTDLDYFTKNRIVD